MVALHIVTVKTWQTLMRTTAEEYFYSLKALLTSHWALGVYICYMINFSGKKRRLTLIECNNDINSMIDVPKIADLVSSHRQLLLSIPMLRTPA